ncbi:MAG: glycine cleavage system protein T [Elusimicrobia bacterium]|nr:glycine cleavage system protein T [Elusimicrobiota bacterium]
MKRTPLYEEHIKLNARMTEFGGWEMPVQYSSIINEHNAVRQHAGLFDASHMGEFVISGKNAAQFLDKVTVANIGSIIPGRAKYSMLLNEKGGVIDDIIIYRRPNDFFVVVNAGNIEKDFNWLQENLIDGVHPVRESSSLTNKDVTITPLSKNKSIYPGQELVVSSNGVILENISDKIGLLALQGPESQKIMEKLVNDDLSQIKYFGFINPSWKEMKPEYSILARTGYTGEDGFEIFITNDGLKVLWNKLISMGVTPCGLGARDTLRLEACMPLHGHEINDDITPLEAGLDWAIFWDKDFIGKQALLKQKKEGLKKFLSAIIMEEGIPRAGCDILMQGKKTGIVKSGTFSPTFRKGIGLGYIEKPAKIGDILSVLIHNQEKSAKVVQRPFYKRKDK